MRISMEKLEGEWCSWSEPCGRGDGKRTEFQTPFPSREARGLHVMRDFTILPPNFQRRILNPDGSLLRDEPDGYATSTTGPDDPVTITFEQPVPLDMHISVSVIGRQPAKGEAFKVLPMTDTLAQQLDEKLPPSLRRRKTRDDVIMPEIQTMYRDSFQRLVVDFSGFVDGKGDPIPCNEATKKKLIDVLGSVALGAFARDRAVTLQREMATGLARELSD